ncbi:hypothetical protein TNCV_388551 [Trichonephila clavipes]|nr:hypothetical protein TNCV_388551 [Trichonephila clavipes]
MPPFSQCQIEAHEVHHGKELDSTPDVSRSFQHYAAEYMRSRTCQKWLPSLLPGHQKCGQLGSIAKILPSSIELPL